MVSGHAKRTLVTLIFVRDELLTRDALSGVRGDPLLQELEAM